MRLIYCLFVGFVAVASPVAHSAAMEGYSTVLRVEFVFECMRDREGARYEMMNKCSCVMDRLGEVYDAKEFVDAWTVDIEAVSMVCVSSWLSSGSIMCARAVVVHEAAETMQCLRGSKASWLMP